MNTRVTAICALVLLAGCAEEVPPPSVEDYLENPNMLEAAVVRCAQNRAESRYDAECVNARQAISIIEAKEERARRDAFERESERKRQALRRTQQAAAEARRRAEEAERARREAEYQAQFGDLPPPAPGTDTNAPGAALAETPEPSGTPAPTGTPASATEPATDGGNAPVAEQQEAPPTDLDAIREELQRRNDETGN